MIKRAVKIAALFIAFLAVTAASAYLALTLIIKSEETVIVPELVGKEVVYALELLTGLELDIKVKGSKILVLGITFKENCPDVRNTKAVDVIRDLMSYGADVTVFDPWALPQEVRHEYGIDTTKELPGETFDAVVLAVAHNEYLKLTLRSLLNGNGVLYDVKGILQESVDARL